MSLTLNINSGAKKLWFTGFASGESELVGADHYVSWNINTNNSGLTSETHILPNQFNQEIEQVEIQTVGSEIIVRLITFNKPSNIIYSINVINISSFFDYSVMAADIQSALENFASTNTNQLVLSRGTTFGTLPIRTAPLYTLTYTAAENGSISGYSSQTVIQGADGTEVTAVADAGYVFDYWSDGHPTDSRQHTNVTGNISATAYFRQVVVDDPPAPPIYTLSYAPYGVGGSVSGTVEQSVQEGGNGTEVTAVPAAGYRFYMWEDNNSENPKRTDTNVTRNITARAIFMPTFILTYTAGPNGSINGTSSQTVDYNQSGTKVTAVPNEGYEFEKWSDNESPNPERTDSNVMGDITATAIFRALSYTLTYNVVANGSIDGNSPQTVDHGQSGTKVTAVPFEGYEFESWSDGYTNAERTDSNVTGNISVTATFRALTYTLTYTAGPNGSIDGTSPQTVDHGQNGTQVEAVPNEGYEFDSWSDGYTNASRQHTNVTGNISVTATFKQRVITLITLTLPVTTSPKEYDGTTNALDNIEGGLVSGISLDFPNVEVQFQSAVYNNKEIGTEKTITITFLLVGTDSKYYKIDPVTLTNGEITARTLNAQFSVASKEYDGSDNALPYLTINLPNKVEGDQVTASATNAKYAIKYPGNQTVDISGITLAGADKDNYIISSSGTTSGVITQRFIDPVLTAQDVTQDVNKSPSEPLYPEFELSWSRLLPEDVLAAPQTLIQATFGRSINPNNGVTGPHTLTVTINANQISGPNPWVTYYRIRSNSVSATAPYNVLPYGGGGGDNGGGDNGGGDNGGGDNGGDNPTIYPNPLVVTSAWLALHSGVSLLSQSTTTATSGFSGASAVIKETNVYSFKVTVNSVDYVFIETDVVEWDSHGEVVYKHVNIDGSAGPFGNEIDASVTAVNQVFDPSEDDALVTSIANALNTIKCANVEGMGTIAEYEDLLKEVAKAPADSSVVLDLNIDNLKALADQAEAYGNLFKTITSNVSRSTTISNVALLTKINDELTKIVNMYNNLKSLKLAIAETATLKIPDSITSTANKLQDVYSAVECSLPYLEYFCDRDSVDAPANSAMNAADKAAIDAATGAVQLFNTLAQAQAQVSNLPNNNEVKILKAKIEQFGASSNASSLSGKMLAAKNCLSNKLNSLFNTYNGSI